MKPAPVVKDVCLVGGGHSHVLLLRRWAMRPMAGVRLTLVSSAVQTPYSGMLPGLIAGHYSYNDIHLDLVRLCSWADVRFIKDTVTAINLDARQVHFDQRPSLSFDVLSLDTGSTPDLSVPGAALHVTPVKPVSNFNSHWEAIYQRLQTAKDNSLSIGVVGSGAGGFELVVGMRHRLRDTAARLFWFLRGDSAIGGRPEKVGKLAIQAAMAAGIEVVYGFDVTNVESGKLIAADGRTASLDEIIWCTGAIGPGWPADAGLETDNRGFVATNAFLQSRSHPFVFATGDIGTQVDTPSSKAGVFAVRQAPVLFENIRRYLLRNPLQSYRPQKDFLSLMATGPQHAVASRGPFVVQGDWVWRWKDHIDQTFMDKFRTLRPRYMNPALARLPNVLYDELHREVESTISDRMPVQRQSGMRCRGCGAKVGGDVLQRVLNELMPADDADNACAMGSPAGDTAMVVLPSQRLVQSVDQINAIVDDPYLLGRIAALHALSDVVTVDAKLHSAQVLLTLPESSSTIVERDLRLLMQGVLFELEQESCALIGGHTTQGPEMSIGLAVNATAAYPVVDDEKSAAAGVQVSADDVLVLTKALGTGVLFAGLMQGLTKGTDVNSAIERMLTGNRLAADILRQHGSLAMTDVTGFGLIGHLRRLLDGLTLVQPSADSTLPVGAVVCTDRIPFLTGSLELSRQGCNSSLWSENALALKSLLVDTDVDAASLAMLADPQTSGGLLAVVPKDKASACIDALISQGIHDAACVGFIEHSSSVRICASI